MKIPKGDRTPMLEQFMNIKKKHPTAVLFYRMGDFFEMFYDDARVGSEVLGLRLTSRAHGKTSKVPLAGFPHHQLDNYLTKLVKAGHRVVIVEQVEDPKKAKGLVKRDVVRVVTAGTNLADADRDEFKVNRIASITGAGEDWGLAWADVATGEFYTGQFSSSELSVMLSSIDPVEILIAENNRKLESELTRERSDLLISTEVEWVWEPTFAGQTLLDHFGTANLKGFGIERLQMAISAAGALLHYLKGNLRCDPAHFTRISRADVRGKLIMEATTRRNLELFESISGNRQATLFAVIDKTVTASGRRLLYERMMEPVADKKLLDARLDAVSELMENRDVRDTIRSLLRKSGDIQRYLARLATQRGSARDLVAIREVLILIPEFTAILNEIKSIHLKKYRNRLKPVPELLDKLTVALADDPPLATTEGGMIRDGYNEKIDELREIRNNGKTWLSKLEQDERTKTGINNLKIAYNRVFGYYIEVTKSHMEKVPDHYFRRQTLVNAERYTIQELQDYEQKLFSAEDTISSIESEIYNELVGDVLNNTLQLQDNAYSLAELDVQASLATQALEESYCRPEITEDTNLFIRNSRHPVVEKLLPPGEQFVPNDFEIGEGLRILIITGPNMAGKSTYLRQLALSVILAQMGSFVPADEARIGIVDKLFTRIGAMDNLAGGESTFLVEMQETATILNNATPQSLVLFDEVGRGTSTFDGLSLAWAIVEYLHENTRLRPRTLFATHFHEMVDLEKYLDGVENRNVAVREFRDNIVFLRKIVPGGSDRSFGIHVARMAGLPREVISRAKEVLANLEANDLNPAEDSGSDPVASGGEKAGSKAGALSPTDSGQIPTRHLTQLSFFDPGERRLRDMLSDIDPQSITPIEALNLIIRMKDEMSG